MPSLTGQENFQSSAAGGASHSDLENLKQEILTEMRKEIHAMKNEILAGKYRQLSKSRMRDNF